MGLASAGALRRRDEDRRARPSPGIACGVGSQELRVAGCGLHAAPQPPAPSEPTAAPRDASERSRRVGAAYAPDPAVTG